MPVERNQALCPECETYNPQISVQAPSACSNVGTVLSVGESNIGYGWSTNETTQEITVNNPGTYTVLVGSGVCQKTASITIDPVEKYERSCSNQRKCHFILCERNGNINS